MMTPERSERAVQMLIALKADIEADVARRDGMLLTGRNVAEALGEIAAQVDALANVLIEILRTPYQIDPVSMMFAPKEGPRGEEG